MMKKAYLGLILACVWFLPAAAQQVIELKDVGPLRGAYVIPIDRYSRADVQLIVLSGAYEESGADGTAHYLEHLVALSADQKIFGGFRTRDWNATTYPVATAYWNAAPVDELEQIIAYARAVFDTPDLPEDFMKTEAEIVRRELLLKSRRSPFSYLIKDALVALYGGVEGRARQGYSGGPGSKPLNIDDALAFHASNYQPSNAILIVSGLVDPAKVEKLVRKYFSDMPDKPTPPKRWLTQRPPSDRRIVSEVTNPTLPSDYVVYSKFVSIPFTQDKLAFQMAFQLAGAVLETAMPGGLRRRLHFDAFDAATFGSTSYMSINGDLEQTFYMTPDAGISPRQAMAALEAAIERYRTEPVPQETFDKARNSLISLLQRTGHRPRTYLETYRNFASDGFRPFGADEYVKMLSAVTLDQVEDVLHAIAGPGAVSAVLATRGEN